MADEIERELPELEPLSLEEESQQAQPQASRGEEEPISLTETSGAQGGKKIQAFGAGAAAHQGGRQYRRALNNAGAGATRCKIFHCKIAPGSIEYLEDQINQWLDSNDAEVKFVTQVVGVLEGKHAEPNLFATIWY